MAIPAPRPNTLARSDVLGCWVRSDGWMDGCCTRSTATALLRVTHHQVLTQGRKQQRPARAGGGGQAGAAHAGRRGRPFPCLLYIPHGDKANLGSHARKPRTQPLSLQQPAPTAQHKPKRGSRARPFFWVVPPLRLESTAQGRVGFFCGDRNRQGCTEQLFCEVVTARRGAPLCTIVSCLDRLHRTIWRWLGCAIMRQRWAAAQGSCWFMDSRTRRLAQE